MKKLKLTAVMLIVLSLVVVSGCRDTWSYHGPSPDLNMVVQNSALGILSRDNNTAVILEEDSQGRVLFAFQGESILDHDTYVDSTSFCAFLVSQKTENGYVYYYPDENMILYPNSYSLSEDGELEDYFPRFIQENELGDEIESLKSENDWNKPFNEKKCTKVKVSDETRDVEMQGGLVSEEAKERAYREAMGKEDVYNEKRVSFAYLTSDQYDRHIFYFKTITEDDVYTGSFVVMFNADGSFDPDTGIMEIEDAYDYQDDLKTFKRVNDWGTNPKS